MAMSILLINHYAGSPHHGMAYRPYYLGKEWIKEGNNVTILGASFSHLRSKNPAVTQKATEENIDGIHYIWYKTPGYSGNGIGRIKNIISFLTALTNNSRYLADSIKPDAVITSSTYPLDSYPASKISRHAGAKLVHEVHDLWPLSPMELGNIPAWHPYIMSMQWGENYAYSKSDHVVSLLPETEKHMIHHGLKPGNSTYLPNGINVDEWNNNEIELPAEHARIIDENRAQENFIIGYIGTHGLSNALDTLLDAALRLVGQPITFIFVGQGPDKDSLIQYAEQKEITNVVFLPPVPKRSVPALLNQMDAVYIGAKKSPLYRFGISPNKLMDYMMSAKPIIYAIEAANDPVREAGCGISVPADNPEAIVAAATSLVAMSQSERNQIGRKGKAFVLKNHDYRMIAQRFLEILEK